MEKQNELKKFMQPYGGMAALKFMLESVGVSELTSSTVQSFNRQAIPAKYMPAIMVIKGKYNIDLTSYVRKKEKNVIGKNTKKILYPTLLKKLEGYGLGLIASEINRPNNKNALIPFNTPKRFNHLSLVKLLTKKLSPAMREHFALVCDAEKEIVMDETNQESELLK